MPFLVMLGKLSQLSFALALIIHKRGALGARKPPGLPHTSLSVPILVGHPRRSHWPRHRCTTAHGLNNNCKPLVPAHQLCPSRQRPTLLSAACEWATPARAAALEVHPHHQPRQQLVLHDHQQLRCLIHLLPPEEENSGSSPQRQRAILAGPRLRRRAHSNPHNPSLPPEWSAQNKRRRQMS